MPTLLLIPPAPSTDVDFEVSREIVQHDCPYLIGLTSCEEDDSRFEESFQSRLNGYHLNIRVVDRSSDQGI